jgi:hypothetical protein
MLITLGNRSHAEPALLARFTDCHARIRKFCALARRLGQGDVEGDEAREAALAVHRYFTVALPLHVQDEEDSLAPRLMRVGDDAVTDSLEAMSRDHLELDDNLAALAGRWLDIADDPTRERCAATRWEATCLVIHFDQHLSLEESRIFPAIAKLPAPQADAIAREMKARR